MGKSAKTVLSCLLVLFWAAGAQAGPLVLPMAKAKVGGTRLQVELALTPGQRYQGLSGRSHMGWERGMLFVYPSPRPVVFVMRDMLFPLDFIWISQGKVVGLDSEVPPPKLGEDRRNIPSPGPVDRVLEVNAGWIKTKRVKLGDPFHILE